jgi:hypothetical protein
MKYLAGCQGLFLGDGTFARLRQEKGVLNPWEKQEDYVTVA